MAEYTIQLEEALQGVELAEVPGRIDGVISSVAYDSRRVTPGALFVALPGTRTDGSQYIEEALRRGAVAVITQSPCALGGQVPCFQVLDARRAMAQVAAALYRHPADRLCTVGITGTNGKTTVSFMMREILKAAGRRPGLVGTVRYEIGERILPASRTTPESSDLQAMMAQMTRCGCDSVVMEVSSHALEQHRVEGILYDAAVFTNLTQDHLDYHGTMEAYYQAKARMFQRVRGHAVICGDDPWGERLLQQMASLSGTLSFGFDPKVDVRGMDPKVGADGSRMRVETPWGPCDIRLRMIGRFNLANALAATAAAGALGISPQCTADALAGLATVPGRLEAVPNRRKKRVYIDYAHTDDALRNVLQALREMTPGRLIVVFGCGGNRDTAKRQLMGAVASRLADYSIITNDNPRNEIPEKIAADIATGFDSPRKFETVLDRKSAIERGIDLIGKKDTLLIAGKGHEAYQEMGGAIIPFNDLHTARRAME